MSEEEKQQDKGFTVQDRRRFSPETGEAQENAPEIKEEAKPVAAAANPTAGAGEAPADELPEIDFSTFVISLSTQALFHLGEIANPQSGQPEVDIPVAKQMIDILGMLQEKTKNNLTPNESRLMGDILFDLRMKYVEAVKRK